MMRRGLLGALAIVIVVNLAALIGVARNRSGTPGATVVLEERELELLPAERENSGLSMRLRYQNARFDEDPRAAQIEDALAPRFIDQAKLEALGFDCSVAAGNERATSFYRAVLPRLAFIVFTVGGPEWERQVSAWQERRRTRTDEQIARGELVGDAVERARAEIEDAPRRLSRLMPLDVARDADTLRAQYGDPTRYLILRGVVRLHHVDGKTAGGPSLHGHLDQIFPSLLNVPRDVRAALDALPALPPRDRAPGPVGGWGLAMLDHTPRYEVRVSVGRTLQPWVTEIRALTGLGRD